MDSIYIKSIYKACEYGKYGIVVDFLKKNPDLLNYKSSDGITLLHAACKGAQNLELVKYLIKKGCNINTFDSIGISALSYASRLGHLDIVKYLVEDVLTILEKSQIDSAIIYATYFKKPHVVEYLKNYLKCRRRIDIINSL
jgi:ankyrin repeat protein